MQTAHLIIIGQELLQGKIIEKNFAWAAPLFFQYQIELKKVHVIADTQEAILKSLHQAVEEVDIIITSGGLGPTLDDITKNILASFFQKNIGPCQQTRKIVEKQYLRISRNFSDVENGYDHLPHEFQAIKNPVGLAPGLFYHSTENQTLLYALPGVPKEFQSMLISEVFPHIKQHQKNSHLMENIVYKTWGVPEEKIFQDIVPNIWSDLSQLGQVSSLPHLWGVDLGVMITANTQDELNQKKNNIIQLINQTPLNQYRWQIGSLGLEDYLFMLIQKHQLMFGFAESCSGGLVSHLMTNMPGVSKYFMGSVISYTNQVKQDELNVSSSTLKKYGAVSEEVAREMAIGLKEKFNLDMALSLTGIAGPGGGSEKTPVGTICYGLCLKDKVESFTLNLNGSRDIIKYRFAYRGLHLLRDLIIRELGE